MKNSHSGLDPESSKQQVILNLIQDLTNSKLDSDFRQNDYDLFVILNLIQDLVNSKLDSDFRQNDYKKHIRSKYIPFSFSPKQPMWKNIIALLSVVLVSISFGLPTLAQTTQTDNETLNEIFRLLDEELAQREQETVTKYGNDENELQKAISTIHSMGITKFDTVDTFMADKAIRRDEAATMFYRFVTSESSLSATTVNNNCDFPDLSEAHSDLIEVVQNSCKAGLFYGAQGRFLPRSSITNAQAITVMARILDGRKDETGDHRADEYYDVLTQYGVMFGLAMRDKRNYDDTITRGDIAILLYRVHNELEG